MSLTPEDEVKATRLFKDAFSEVENNDHITHIILPKACVDILTSLHFSQYALLYGKSESGVVSLEAIPFSWTGNTADVDLRTTIAVTNDVLPSRRGEGTELIGLYMPGVRPVQMEGYLELGFGLQVVMGGKVFYGQERERTFYPHAISRDSGGNHFGVTSIKPAK